ncbi:ATP-binding protein [Phaeobacter sp. NW0010-22]|uniref:ATP-binding protein n=1 Tax=Phaeobacter sp. NW0010-22 TaxID=3135907 RepID=UPI003103A8A2
METDELQNRFALAPKDDGEHRISARESTELEFKRALTLATFRKSPRTIAAFANKTDGQIVFGISDKSRLRVLSVGMLFARLLALSACPCLGWYD